MNGRISLMLGAALAGVLAMNAPALAAPHGVKVGILICHVKSGWGYVVGSSKDVDCSYRPDGHREDRYTGSISKFGVDIGYTSGGTIVWDVVAPSSDTRPGALQGDYAGATASATLGAGVGANVLVGGLDKSLALQPVSVEGNTGLDVSAGIGAMSLRAEERPLDRVSEVSGPPTAVQTATASPAAVQVAAASPPPKPAATQHRHATHRVRKTHTCR